MRETDSGLCYAMKNYIDESGRPHNILQIYRYKYSPLCIDSRLTDEDEQYKAFRSDKDKQQYI